MTALWLAASLWLAAFGVSLLLAGILTTQRWMSAPGQALLAWHGLAVATLGAIIIGPLLVAHDVLEKTLIWIVHADKPAPSPALRGRATSRPTLELRHCDHTHVADGCPHLQRPSLVGHPSPGDATCRTGPHR